MFLRPSVPAAVLTAALALPAGAEGAPAEASLTITIQGVLPEPSQLMVGLFDAATWTAGPPPVRQAVPAAAPETVVVFEHLTPGRTAVKVLQDLNGNGKMDKTLIGIPDEPFGLSNNVEPDMAAPGFDETGFDLKPGPNAITIVMQKM